jgi:hypothetical protein
MTPEQLHVLIRYRIVDETFNDATRFVAAVDAYLRPLTSLAA